MEQEVLDFMQTRILTTSNYSQWIKELENLAKHNGVWQYIDPQNDRAKELNLNDYADVQDIDEDDIDILLLDDDEMTDDELELYCLQMEKRRAKKIAFNMKIVHAALRMTAGISEITCTRDVVKFLAARFDKSYKQLNLQSQNVVDRSAVDRPIVDRPAVDRTIVNRSVDCSIVDFLDWFQVDWFNDEDWLKTHSSKQICLAVSSSVADSLDWFERAWFDDTQWLESSHTAVAEMEKLCTVDTVDAVAEMGKPCTVDTVDGNSHTVDTVVSAMENACTDVSYSNNSHILEMNSGSEEHTDHDLISSQYTGHDLILGGGQDKISYITKILDYTQEMMEKFLDGLGSSILGSSTKASNSVDLGQCKKISRDLGELNQNQVINKMKFHLKIQSSINQRDATDGFCRRAKYGHFRSGQYDYFGPDKDGHFGPDKDGFYMPGKWIFRAWCGPAFFKAEGVCQAISGRLVGVG